jgi:hypothetical protein
VTQVVSEADYRLFAADTNPATTTTTTANINAALVSAQARAEQWCQRPFSLGQYVETLWVTDDGLVYPTVPNLISADDPPDVTVQGQGVYLGYVIPGPAVLAGGYSSAFPPQAPLTYTAGFTNATLPESLREGICRIAFRKLNPVALVGVPAGVTQAAVGDVRLQSSAALDGFATLDVATRENLSGWRLRQVRGWQAQPVLVGS